MFFREAKNVKKICIDLVDDISQLEFKNMDGEMGKAGKASFLAVEKEGEREKRLKMKYYSVQNLSVGVIFHFFIL